MSTAVVMSIIKAQQERKKQEELDSKSHSSSYSPIMKSEEVSSNTNSEPKPRDVYAVCEEIMKIIPDSETELLFQLRKFNDTLWNQAPELRRSAMFWRPLGNILQKNITDFEHEWQKNVLKMFNNE
jgi:hypothetical protein